MQFDITRAWKDERYRQTLSADQRAMLPAHPAGELELSDDELAEVVGGQPGQVVGLSRAYARDEQFRSCALICEINIYSINIGILDLNILRIAQPSTRICTPDHH